MTIGEFVLRAHIEHYRRPGALPVEQLFARRRLDLVLYPKVDWFPNPRRRHLASGKALGEPRWVVGSLQPQFDATEHLI